MKIELTEEERVYLISICLIGKITYQQLFNETSDNCWRDFMEDVELLINKLSAEK